MYNRLMNTLPCPAKIGDPVYGQARDILPVEKGSLQYSLIDS